MIGNVYEFHQKFGLPLGTEDQLLDDIAAQEFRVKFMREELDEFIEAIVAGDRVKALDALLDLDYVVHGTALFMGVSPAQWDAGMRAVHNCNMAKVRVAKAEESKRGSAFDVMKPVGWAGPETRLKEILSW
jgi:predicted HAD superfamily Cof-like phosphohydrolase